MKHRFCVVFILALMGTGSFGAWACEPSTSVYDDDYDYHEYDCSRGFVDEIDEVVIPSEYDYDEVWDFSEGLAVVELDDRWGFIDTTGTVVIPLQYDEVWHFSEGLAKVKKNNKWGFVDKRGKMVISLQYDDASYFKNGKAKVKLRGETFYINKQGKRVGNW